MIVTTMKSKAKIKMKMKNKMKMKMKMNRAKTQLKIVTPHRSKGTQSQLAKKISIIMLIVSALVHSIFLHPFTLSLIAHQTCPWTISTMSPKLRQAIPNLVGLTSFLPSCAFKLIIHAPFYPRLWQASQ